MSQELVGQRYLLEREVRRTARLTAYAALDTQSQLPVTIKLLRPDLLAQPAYRAELSQRLAVVKGGLPWAPALLDLELDGDRPFIAERVTAGRTVGDRLRAGESFGADQLTSLAAGAAQALTALHHGPLLMHGTLCPESLLVAGDQSVLLLDCEQPVSPLETVDQARYAAPEVLSGDPVDARADLHALSCILYQAALGQAPFDGPSPLAISANKQRHVPDSLTAWRTDLPAGLVAAVSAGLQREAVSRPADATAFAKLLTQGAAASAATMAPPLGATQILDKAVAMPAASAAAAYNAASAFNAAAAVGGPPAAAPRPPQPVRRESGGAGPFLAVIVVLLIGGGLWWALKHPGGSLTVPALAGMNEEQAIAKLKEVGLKGTQNGSDYDDKVPDGQVLRQQPESGARLNPGDTVQIILSKGSKNATLPSLVNMSEKEAKAELTKRGLKYGSSETVERADAPNGVVVDQFPKAGASVERGSRVSLFVNKKPKDATTPPATPPTDPGKTPDADKTTPDAGKDAKGNLLDRAVEKGAELGREATRKAIEAAKDQLKNAVGGGKDEKK